MDKGTFGYACIGIPVRFSDRPCAICSAPSTGVHYGVVSCNGCKAFYYRSATNMLTYRCRHRQQCIVGPQTKQRCRACRFNKCLDAGMKLASTPMGRIPHCKRYNILIDGNSASAMVKKASLPGEQTHSDQTSRLHLETLRKEALALRSRSPEASFSGPPVLRSLSVSPVKDTSMVIRSQPVVVIGSVADLSLGDAMKDTAKVWDTISAFHSTQCSVYGDNNRVWQSDHPGSGNTPCNPRMSVETIYDLSRDMASDAEEKHSQLFFGLPGVTTFSHADQQQLPLYWPLSWLVVHFRNLREDGVYLRKLTGSISLFYHMDWMAQTMSPAACRETKKITKGFRDLQLTDLEAHLLCAVSVFSEVSDNTSIESRGRHLLMQAHYADCLRFVIRSNYRGDLSETDIQLRENKIFDFVATCQPYSKLIMGEPMVVHMGHS